MRQLTTRIAAFAFLLTVAPAAKAGAQAPAGARPMVAGPGEIRGKLADSASGKAVTSGSITVRRGSDTAFAGGALPKEDGTFRVDGLAPGTYSIRVRALGFGQLVRTGILVTTEKPVVDLGLLKLTTMAATLEGQQVVAEREETVVQPDRTSYSTKNMTAASGGNAVDVLRNIPQVEVDGSNKVSLRGNGNVVIQINGRSTPLKGDQLAQFLSQMPASTVKTVEVAANPSAKDDPEGTAGIINIVLNQEAELGLSGGVNAGTSSTRQVNASGNIGKQHGPVTGFASLYLYSDRRATSGTTSRENLTVQVPAFTETKLSGRQRPLSVGGNLRGEYRFTETDALTFDGYGGANQFKGTNQSFYNDLDAGRDIIGQFNQLNDNNSRNRNIDLDLAFRRQGKPTAPQLTVEAEYANNTSDNDINLSGLVTKAGGSTPASIPNERNLTKGAYPFFTAKIDYSYPFSPATKLETGVKYLDRATTNDFTALYQNGATGAYEVAPARSSSYKYQEYILGAYALLSRRIGKFQTQGGLRLENADTRFELPITGQGFDKRYASAYPSAVVTYNLTDMRTLRTTYSRRVSRPNPFQLSPIEFRQDSRNLFRGNPELGAEYTNAFDMNFTEAKSWGSIQLTGYLRRSNNAVRSIQYVDANGISIQTFANLSRNQSLGSDLNVNLRRGAFTGAVGGGTSYYTSEAGNVTLTSANLSTKAFSWTTRANGTWKFSNLFDTQIFSYYRPPTKTEGGSSLAQINMSLSARYKAWGDAGNISLRFNDPFGIQKFGYRTANGSVIEYSERFFGARAVFLTVSKNFGQALRLRAKSDSEGNPTGPATP